MGSQSSIHIRYDRTAMVRWVCGFPVARRPRDRILRLFRCRSPVCIRRQFYRSLFRIQGSFVVSCYAVFICQSVNSVRLKCHRLYLYSSHSVDQRDILNRGKSLQYVPLHTITAILLVSDARKCTVLARLAALCGR
jgi:hypothetical protein